MRVIVAFLVALIAFSGAVDAKQARSRSTTYQFQKLNPCPSTGRQTGACPGWRKDHTIPLACGGPDSVSNLTWMTVEQHAAKSKWERKGCGR